ncbi:hypothetical protein DFR69_106242 [Nocardia neocaledoniensis]|uniref:Uncharacterized protein n=1 Tax=Nocardia neocaledoniensis TaxID=236511 RepID=A0A317NGI7_9NOCA|nr:hypothetical protein DFR69_106242 [Nocardia neocaledoniensis]
MRHDRATTYLDTPEFTSNPSAESAGNHDRLNPPSHDNDLAGDWIRHGRQLAYLLVVGASRSHGDAFQLQGVRAGTCGRTLGGIIWVT